MAGSKAGSGAPRNLPKSIWALGFVSLFMDVSSELVHSLLPIFLTTVLGASMVTIGVIEGIAEGTAAVTKVFSGVISDRVKKRKTLAVLGYGLGAATKPVFPLATSVAWVFSARFVDRVGKGIRGAPRDALVADLTPPQMLGAAYGLRQSLDSVGAFVGPLLAVAFMAWFADDLRAVLWVASLPAAIAVLVLVLAVREPERELTPGPKGPHPILASARRLPRRYWLIVLLGAILTLARFSEAFLILRAQSVGIAIGFVPLVMVVMNVVYAALAYPAGMAADRLSRRMLLIIGLVVLVISDLVLAAADTPLWAFLGTALWGAHMGLTQGLLSKLVADTAPADLRGSAFGVFNLVTGGALLLASLVAGSLWSAIGPEATFMAGAGFAAVAAVGLSFYRPGATSERAQER